MSAGLSARMAALLRAAAPKTDATVAADVCARAVAMIADGHSAMPVDAATRAALLAHPWVGTGAHRTPFVLDGGLLYVHRHWVAERALATALRERAALARLRVITGGPGTGKTTKAGQLIREAMASRPGLRVALAAPTGKAATRLGEAVGQPGVTLHRLLGYHPGEDRFRRTPENPLEHDLVVVDEASMVPLLLMQALVAALRPEAMLVLLGDHEQLASVEAGSVLADIVRGGASGALRGAVEVLRTSHRFRDDRGIGALARAVREGDADAALAALRSGDAELAWPAHSAADPRWLEEVAAEQAQAVLDAASAEDALEALGRQRILCATNVGPAGSIALNHRMERVLKRSGRAALGQGYQGQPVLLGRNLYAHDLYNGDVGVYWGDTDGEERVVHVHFGGGRRVLPSQLSDVSTAWAMSVHKSQGSEFDTAIVVLPDRDVPTLSRELLYTALTRARRRVVLAGSEEMLRIAVSRSARRVSGLSARL